MAIRHSLPSVKHCSQRLLICLSATLFAIALSSCSKNNESEEAKKPSSKVTPQLNAAWPKLPGQHKDKSVETRIAKLLAKMSLEQKIGQMLQPAISNVTPEQAREFHIGSILNGGGMYPNDNRNATPNDWLTLADAYYEASMTPIGDLPAIPIIWGTDAVHGHNNVIGATLFPHNSALGATGNPELVQQIAAATAREVVATGIDWTFAPTIAVAQNIRWGRSYESFSENPGLVAQMADAAVTGYQGRLDSSQFLNNQHILATAKHFIADGGTDRGDDQGINRSSEEELINLHAQGYFAALSAGAQSVMASYSSWHALPMHANKYLLTTVLKQHMGFDGLVVSDWNALAHIDGCTRDNCAAAVNAGVDLFMIPYAPDWQNMIANIKTQVETGIIPPSRIDDAVTRILRVKIRAGLFEKGKPSSRSNYQYEKYLSVDSHRHLAREAVRESLVLLKNNNSILPLNPSKHILVTGNAANDASLQSGGWSISWQGHDTKPEDYPTTTTIYQAIANATQSAGGKAQLSIDGSYTQKPDVAVVVFGEQPYAEMYGDIENLETLEYAKENATPLARLSQYQADGIATVALFVSGRPRLTTKEINKSDAFVMAWLPGSEATGITDVLFSHIDGSINFDFNGSLSFAWPSQPCPDSPDYETKLFPFGFGLNYRTQNKTPTLSEAYEQRRYGCDLHNDLYPSKPYQLTTADWFAELELKSVEGVRVEKTTGWNGLAIDVQRDKSNSIEKIDLAWSEAPKVNMMLRNGRKNHFVDFVAADYALVLDVNLSVKPDQDVYLFMECGDLCAEPRKLTDTFSNLPLNKWQTLYLPLSCEANLRTDFAKINSALRLDSSGNFALSLRNMRFAPAPKSDAIRLCD